MNRIRTIAIVLALALAACGGGSSDDKAENASSDDTTTSTIAADGGGAGGASTTAPAAGSSSAKPGASSAAGGTATTAGPGGGSGSSATTETTVPPKLTATLKSKCVRPGGSQTLDVDTDPGLPVGYTSTYSDKKSGMEPDYYGGSNHGQSDGDGDYTATWTIAPTAPAGPVEVKVFVAGTNGMASADLTFEMANAAGKCD